MPARPGCAADRRTRAPRPRRRPRARSPRRHRRGLPRRFPGGRDSAPVRRPRLRGRPRRLRQPAQLAARLGPRPASRHSDHAGRGADRGGPPPRARPRRRRHARPLPGAGGRRRRPVRRPVPPHDPRPGGLREAVRHPARRLGPLRARLPRPGRAAGGDHPHAHQPPPVVHHARRPGRRRCGRSACGCWCPARPCRTGASSPPCSRPTAGSTPPRSSSRRSRRRAAAPATAWRPARCGPSSTDPACVRARVAAVARPFVLDRAVKYRDRP